MKAKEKVIGEAGVLFDAAGITSTGKDSILILGLLTSAKHDLDEFSMDKNGIFRINGFEKHVRPKLDFLVSSLQEQDPKAEVLGQCVYTAPGTSNLKLQAFAAGLGMWGKNSMVLHPRFGLRLRLMSIKIHNIVLSTNTSCTKSHTENPLCRDCNACIDACPLGILKPYYLQSVEKCLANIELSPEPGKMEYCYLCWQACSAGL